MFFVFHHFGMYKKNIVTFHFLQRFQIDHFLYSERDDSIVYSRKEESQEVFQTRTKCFYLLYLLKFRTLNFLDFHQDKNFHKLGYFYSMSL
uniref:NADH dehydrogenase subunit 5 n=1 Tax=Helleborus torquatus TaxID=171901 RepID=UPI0025A9D90D|nr:NADH dehydrogenase subunit 5 [Helleborus torquatus]WIW41697.1 NADH dehydrogenase subunit 5 [Helleborus torquatus]